MPLSNIVYTCISLQTTIYNYHFIYYNKMDNLDLVN